MIPYLRFELSRLLLLVMAFGWTAADVYGAGKHAQSGHAFLLSSIWFAAFIILTAIRPRFDDDGSD